MVWAFLWVGMLAGGRGTGGSGSGSGIGSGFGVGIGSVRLAAAEVDVLTYRYDGMRTGRASHETLLTPTNCNTNQFGRLFTLPVDGFVYAQPLYLSGISIPGRGVHNLVLVATEHDTVYAFDADDHLGANAEPLWETALARPADGITAQPISDYGLNDLPATELGITGTPVIDPNSGILYVVAKIKDASSLPVKHRQLLYALDVHTGSAVLGSPVEITASMQGTGSGADLTGNIVFDPYYEFQRCGLGLVNGVVYIAFASQGDLGPYHGWVLGYDAQTLNLVRVFNDTPDGEEGGIWMSGGAPAIDADGNLFVCTGNGTFSADQGGRDYGDSVVRLAAGPNYLLPTDSFTPPNQAVLEAIDGDLGSGGVLLLPDEAGSAAHPHLAAVAGKDGTLYLLDRDHLGGFSTNGIGSALQAIPLHAALFGTPAYFDGRIYVSGVRDSVKSFAVAQGRIDTNSMTAAPSVLGYPGSIPVVSANGTTNGIVWAVQADGFSRQQPAILHAYLASDVSVELYHSEQAGTRDRLGLAQKFAVPTVAQGKVYVGTGGQVEVFGLLPATRLSVQRGAGGNSLVLTLEGQVGSGYILQRASDSSSLGSAAGADGNWIQVATVQLRASPTSLTLPIPANGDAGYYRLVRGE